MRGFFFYEPLESWLPLPTYRWGDPDTRAAHFLQSLDQSSKLCRAWHLYFITTTTHVKPSSKDAKGKLVGSSLTSACKVSPPPLNLSRLGGFLPPKSLFRSQEVLDKVQLMIVSGRPAWGKDDSPDDSPAMSIRRWDLDLHEEHWVGSNPPFSSLISILESYNIHSLHLTPNSIEILST